MKNFSLKELCKITNTTPQKIQSYKNSNIISFTKSQRNCIYTEKTVEEVKTIQKFEKIKRLFTSKSFKSNNITFHNTSISIKLQLLKMKENNINLNKPALVDMILNPDHNLSIEERYAKYYSNIIPPPTLESFKLRYGIKLGEKKYNTKINKFKKHNTLDGLIALYGTIEGRKKYLDKIEKTKNTKENFIKRHGEEKGCIKYNDYISKIKHSEKKFIEKYGEKEGKKRWNEFRKNIGNTEENFIKKYGEEKGIEKYLQYKKKLSMSLDKCKERYGEKEGKKQYAKRLKHMKDMNSPDFFVKKYGEKKGMELIENRKNTKKNFLKRYGEKKGLEKWNKHTRNIANTEENFIRVHGKEEGTKRWDIFRKKTANTKENFIRVHGKEEGTKRWIKYKNGNAGYRASKESLEIFKPLTKFAIEKGIEFDDIFCGHNNSFEFKIETGKKTNSYDFTILSLKLIFEYNGSHVHPSKKRLTESEWKKWKMPWTGESADEKYSMDQDKIKAAEKQGFTVVEIWDYEDKNESLNKCKKLIEDRL